MKKRILPFIALLFIATTSFVNAQSKIAHINVQALLADMPEMKVAQEQLKKLEETYKADLQSSYKEFTNKAKQYESEANSKTPAENEKRAVELQNFERNLGEAQQAASQDLQKKNKQNYYNPY